MIEMVLGPEVTVELIRSMRAEGFFPTPAYIVDLAQAVGELWPDVGVSENGRREFEIFSPPLILTFSLSVDDIEPVTADEDITEDHRRRERHEALFSLLDHDENAQTIVDLGRVKTRLASPVEINSAGLEHWNDYVEDIESGEWVLAELKVKLRNYVLDVESQVGYRIGFNRISQLGKGEINIPVLANKKIMVVNFHLLTVDGEPVAVADETTGRSYYLDGDGRVPAGDYEVMMQRTLSRAFAGQHVSYADNKEDEIKNADLLARNTRFRAEDYPLFFDDLVRFEVMGEKVDRCKRTLPRVRETAGE